MATARACHPRARRFRLAGLGVLAVFVLVVAACDPAPPMPPPPPPKAAAASPWRSTDKQSQYTKPTPPPETAPAQDTPTTPPPVGGAVGPAAPGSAWRSSIGGDLSQWSDSPVCGSAQAPAPAASPGAPVQYVAVTENASGRPEAHSLTVTSTADKDAQLTELEQTSGHVTSFEVDTGVHELAIDDPLYTSGPQYAIDHVHYPTAWGSTPPLQQGQGVRVAVVDSGVQADHPDLGRTENGGAVAPGADFLPSSVVGDERTDSGTHGTHVAGIVGMRDNTIGGIGGTPQVTIVPVRVLQGSSGSIANVISGIVWAADPVQGNADVINLSLGSAQCSETLYQALFYAVHDAHVTVVAAAGNCSCTTERLYPAAFSSNLVGVMAIASTDANDQHSSFSNVNDYLTISAPGSSIWSTVPATGYGIKSGTSMASPAVAAVVALLKAKCPSYTPAQVQNRLTSTAQVLGAANVFGAGLVRADNALAPAC